MKRYFALILTGTFVLCGCNSDNSGQTNASQIAAPKRPAYVGPTTAESAEVVATVRGDPITMQQLMEPLIDAHGLTMLLNLVQLELAKQAAAKAQVTVTQSDFDNEYSLTLDQAFKDHDDKQLIDAIDNAEHKKDVTLVATLRDQLRMEHEDYLTQYLNKMNIDRVDFNIRLKMNAYLRKVAEPQVAKRITEDSVKKVFGQMYGETIEVEWIQLSNMTQVTKAQQRLGAGDSFEEVARDMSMDRSTAPSGGKLPPFSREQEVPAAFKDVAFSLRDGQRSDPVAVGSSFALIKRLRLNPPKAVKFENQRDVCTRVLHDKLMEFAMKDMQHQLAFEARTQIDIIHPGLARQWQDKLNRDTQAAERASKELDKDQIRKDLHRVVPDDANNKNTSGTAPGGNAAPRADIAPAGERPPATQPG